MKRPQTWRGKAFRRVSCPPAALTLSIGGVLEFSQVQVGVFVGVDYINNNKEIDWNYQGKPWFSVGLGYSLFNKTAQSADVNTAHNNVPISALK